MLCQICTKNAATVKYWEISQGKIKELHLCENCAKIKEKGIDFHFTLEDLLGDFLPYAKEISLERELRCPRCDTTYSQFEKTALLGCSYCYQTFKEALLPLLKKIHGETVHRGRKPRESQERGELNEEIRKLRGKLAECVEKEEYEEAAKLRDRIRKLEEGAYSHEV